MCASISLAFPIIILIVATSTMQLPPPTQAFDHQTKKKDSPTPLKSERTTKIIEYIYLDKVRKSRITKKSQKDDQDELKNSEKSDNRERFNNRESPKSVKNPEDEENEEEMDTYICRRMHMLQRVPMCVRLFDQPHYKDELKIKFNFLAYRSAKPECVKHELVFRTESMSMNSGVRQEMLSCPGRHHPLRTSWELDDYRDVFYVSSGAVPAPSSTKPASRDGVSALGRSKSKFKETDSFSEGIKAAEAEPDIFSEGVDGGTDYLSKETGSGLEERDIDVKETETTRGRTEKALGFIASASRRTEPVTKRPIPNSLVVYKREWDADTEKFFVYDIIEDFEPKTLKSAIVTEYDVEEDLHSMNAISYNSNAAEVEVIYIREMFKPLDPHILYRLQGTRLSRQDKMADLYVSELVTLCWVILDQPQYKDIDFEPQPPPKQMDEVPIVAEQKVINFKHSVHYNKKSIKQKMYVCKPRSKRTAKANPERIQISSGARPNSYFIYTLHKREDWGKYNIFEFVENLPLERGTTAEKSAEIASDHKASVNSPTERNTENFEEIFIKVVHERDGQEDIVCRTLNKDQLTTLCVRLFQTDHYAKEVGIFFNYRLSLMGRRLESCQKRKVTIVYAQLQNTTEMYHRMGVCEGRHDILRTNHKLDDYKDVFHVSQGPDSNSVMVFRQNKTADAEWYQVYDIVPMQNLEKLDKFQVTLNHIREEYNQSLESSYNSNGPEIEVIYIREMFKSTSAVDTLAGQPEGKIIALCYKLLDQDPYRAPNFEISKAALYTWRTRIKTYRLAFAHSKEYNDEHPTQPMYPCYGRHKDSEVGWKKDEYLHLYKISSGSRPNSFFVYSLLSTENQQRIYTVHEFVENVEKEETLKPVTINSEDVREDLRRGNSVAPGSGPKTGNPTKKMIGKPKQDEMKDVKLVNTRNRVSGLKSAEPKKVLANQKPAQIDQNKRPTVKSTSTKPDKLLKGAMKNPKPIKIKQEPQEELKQVIMAKKSIIRQNPDKSKAEMENIKPIINEPEVAGKMKLVNTKERKPLTKPDDSNNVAIGSLTATETKREEAPKDLKQVISEALITQTKPEEPIKMNIKNSEQVNRVKIPEKFQQGSAKGRKTWTTPSESIKIAEEKPKSVTKQVISEELITQTKPEEPIKMNIENSEQVDGVKIPEKFKQESAKGRKTWTTPNESMKIAEEKPKSVTKQVISEALITQTKPEEPIEMNIKNSEQVGRVKIPEEFKTGSAKGRKTWIMPNESIKIAEEKPKSVTKQVISEELITQIKLEEPIEMNIKNSEQADREKIPEERKTWTMPNEPINMEGEKLKPVKSKEDNHPSPKSTISSEQIIRLKPRPIKTEVEEPDSQKNEIENVRNRLRSINSNNRGTRPIVTEPIKTESEKSEPVDASKEVLKQNPSEVFAPPRNIRTGRNVNFKDISDSQHYLTVS